MKLIYGLIFAVATLIGGYSQAALIGGKVSSQEYVYDFAKDGGVIGFIDLADAMKLPAGSMVMRGAYVVSSAMTSGGAATLAIGDAASGARYLAATAFNNAAYSAGNLAIFAAGVPLNVDAANKGQFGVTVAGAALTAGKIKFMLEVWSPKQ